MWTLIRCPICGNWSVSRLFAQACLSQYLGIYNTNKVCCHLGWSGGAKVLCILHHWGVQLILAYSWARPAILVVGKGRGGMFLFLLFLHFHSCSSFFPVPLFHLLYSLLPLFSLSLGDDTKWPSRVDVSLNPNTTTCKNDQQTITKTHLYNFDPLKTHFCIVKLGFTWVYIIFLILLKNIDCGYSLEPPRQGGSNKYPQSMFWEGNMKNIRIFYLKIFLFWL